MTGLSIVASGMVTPVGFNSASSCAAIRARIRNVRQTNVWDAASGECLTAGRVELPHWWVGAGKLAELAAPSILECFQAARPIPPEEIPVLIGVAPADRPFRFPNLEAELLPEIEERLGIELHPDSGLIPRDHVSVVFALREAGRLIAERRARCVVVASVDSLLMQELADFYASKSRLLTPNNSNGFSLGEASGAVLVVSGGAGPELQILGMGMARERATIESEEPLRAEGLTEAIRGAFSASALTIHDVQYRITDLNGEHYKFKEMVLAMIRFERKPKLKLFELWHPIEYIGDVGAAVGTIVLGVALHAGQKGYGVGPTVLCTFGNDNGERAALVLHYRTGSNGRE